MIHYVYKTTCPCGYLYIGKHSTNDINDGYIGSGHKLFSHLKAHGRQHFAREILSEHATSEEAFAREAELVTQDFLLKEGVLNIVPGGGGLGIGASHPKYGVAHNQVTRQQQSDSLKKFWKNISEEERVSLMNRSKASKNTLSAKRNYSDSKLGEKNPMHGKNLSAIMGEGARKKAGESIKARAMAKPVWRRGRYSPRSEAVWRRAQEIFELWRLGKSSSEICKALSLDSQENFRNIEYFKIQMTLKPMFDGGWVPEEDVRWLEDFKGDKS